MSHLTNHQQPIVIDLTYPLEDLLTVFANYHHEEVFTVQELLTTTLSMLHYSFQLSHAIEAMMIEINTFYPIPWTPQIIQHMERCVGEFITDIHSQFQLYQLYDQTGELAYTLGGFMSTYIPLFIPRSLISQCASAIDRRSVSEYDYPTKYPAISEIDWNDPIHLSKLM